MAEQQLYPATKGGRCSNGFERDRGTVVHAVLMRDPKAYEMGEALCGTEPGRRSVGWTHWPNMVVNCPRCLQKIRIRNLGEDIGIAQDSKHYWQEST